jgi:hypothetical protein
MQASPSLLLTPSHKKLNPSYAGSPQTQIRSTRQANPCPPEEARKREGKKGGRDSIEETKPPDDKNINKLRPLSCGNYSEGGYKAISKLILASC